MIDKVLDYIEMILKALILFIVTGWINWPLMVLWQWEPFPKLPSPQEVETNTSDGSFYHKWKGIWSEWFRGDGEWWSKFTLFVIWWEAAYIVWAG